MKNKFGAVVAVSIAASMCSANALTVFTANDPQAGQSNLIHDACGLAASTDQGTLVVGCLNDTHTALVNVTSDESLMWASGGQARVEGQGSTGTFSQLTLSPQSGTFSSVVLNLNASADGFVRFSDGSSTSQVFALSANGQNFFTLAGPLSSLTITTFSDAAGTVEADLLQDVRQVRLAIAPVVPEPQTYALMLAGLAAAGLMARNRRR